MRNIIILLFSVIFLGSCSTSKHTYRSNSIQDMPVVATEVVVDVKVDLNKKIQSASSKRSSVELAKSEAYYKAITENNIDIVVDPIFEVKTSDKFLFFGGKSIAKLNGFAGYYINPRPKTEAIKELKVVDTLDIHKYNNIYLGIPFPVVNKIVKVDNKSKVILNTGANKSNQNNVAGIVSNVKKEAALKSNFGFKTASTSNILTVDEYGDEDNNGLAVGFFYDSNPNGKFGLKSELMYSFNELQDHISLPFLARYSITKKLNLFAGPSATFFLDSDLSTLSVGFDYGLSFDLGKKLVLDLKFSKGLNDIGDYQEVKYKTSSLGIAYRF